jgi:hypothetical protein
LLVFFGCGSELPVLPPPPPPPPPPVNMTGCNGKTTGHPDRGAMHIMPGTPINYVDNPPASGDHRFEWAKWGEYSSLPPERWVHNLEHGGAAFLYNETTTSSTVEALRAYARNRPVDEGGLFRYVMAPHAGLPTKIAVVCWTWTYEADAVCPGEIDAFLTAHYRKTFEDIPSDGPFNEGWIQR